MTTLMKNKVRNLNSRIENWFAIAKEDYGVEGKVDSIIFNEKKDTIKVSVIENGVNIE